MAAGSVLIDLMLKTGAFETDTKKAEKRWNDMTRSISGDAAKMAATFAGVITVGSVIKMADEYSQMASRIKNSTTSAEEYELVQKRLSQSAKDTYRSLGEAQAMFVDLSSALTASGKEIGQQLDFVDSLSFSFVANAASAQGAASAVNAVNRSLLTGKVTVNDWVSILSAADNTAGLLAKTMGKTEEEVRKLGVTGKITADDLFVGLTSNMEQNKELAVNMSSSVTDGFTRVQNASLEFVGRLNESTKATQHLSDFLSFTADNVDKVAGAVNILSAIMIGRYATSLTAVTISKGLAIKTSIQNTIAMYREAEATTFLARAKGVLVSANKAVMLSTGVGLVASLAAATFGFYQMGKAAKDATVDLGEQKKTIGDLAIEYKKLNDGQRFSMLYDAQNALKDATKEYQDSIRKFEGFGAAKPFFQDFREGKIQLDEFLESVNKLGIYDERAMASIAKVAKGISDKGEAAKYAENQVKLLTDSTYRNEQASKSLSKESESATDKQNSLSKSFDGVKSSIQGASEELGKYIAKLQTDIDTSKFYFDFRKQGYGTELSQSLADAQSKNGGQALSPEMTNQINQLLNRKSVQELKISIDQGKATGGKSLTQYELMYLRELPEVKKFLGLIQKAEGAKGYNYLFGNKPFEDMSKHPNVRQQFRQTDGKMNVTTAAGQYQMINGTWNGIAKQYGLTSFSPMNQDMAAIALLKEIGALDDILKGNIKSAVTKAGGQWASLPSAPDSNKQNKHSWDFVNKYYKGLEGGDSKDLRSEVLREAEDLAKKQADIRYRFANEEKQRELDLQKELKEIREAGLGKKETDATILEAKRRFDQETKEQKLAVERQLSQYEEASMGIEAQIRRRGDLERKEIMQNMQLNEQQKQAAMAWSKQNEDKSVYQPFVDMQNESAKRFSDLEFEIGLTGKAAKEIEKLRFFRELDAKAKAMSVGMSDEYIAKLTEEIEKQRELFADYQMAKELSGDDWKAGIYDGLTSFMDSAGTMRDQFANATTGVMNSLGDALGNFAATGKMNFREMASSILADLAKIAIRMAVMRIFGNMFGNGFGEAAAPSAAWSSGSSGYSSMFDNLKLLSSGGYTGDGGVYEPAGIVHKGEVVFSQADVKRFGGVDKVEAMRTRGIRGYSNGGVVGGSSSPASGAPSGITVNVTVNQDGSSEASVTDDMGKSLDNMITVKVKKEIGQWESNAKRPGGPLYNR